MPDSLPTTYTAKAGETWALLAYRYYGEETLMWKLIEANPLMARIVIFDGGERLHIPKVQDEDRNSAKPPWMQD